VFHEASSVVRILHETGAGRVVTFASTRSPASRLPEIRTHLEEMLGLPEGWHPPTRWDAFAPYATRAMTARLAEALDVALAFQDRGAPAMADVRVSSR
jgi:hypothetical protein